MEERSLYGRISRRNKLEISHTISYNCTKSTKLRCFHFKLLNIRIATNVLLCKAGIYHTDHCTFCKQEPETLLHF